MHTHKQQSSPSKPARSSPRRRSSAAAAFACEEADRECASCTARFGAMPGEQCHYCGACSGKSAEQRVAVQMRVVLRRVRDAGWDDLTQLPPGLAVPAEPDHTYFDEAGNALGWVTNG